MMTTLTVRKDLTPLGAMTGQILRKYSDIILILSPPRSASTALARVFWEHPHVGYYSHEPFDLVYYEGQHPVQALRRIEGGMEIAPRLTCKVQQSDALVVKEMTFQVGHHFSLLAPLVTKPIVFLIRDPRLSIYSRLKKLTRQGGPVRFPLNETGWDHLLDQVAWCQQCGVPYVVVDATAYRLHPVQVLGGLFSRLGLIFSPRLLHWQAVESAELGSLGEAQRHWYQRVLNSTGIEPPREGVPDPSVFDRVDGLRLHVERSYQAYRELLDQHQYTQAGSLPDATDPRKGSEP